jgi:hypothetical protein
VSDATLVGLSSFEWIGNHYKSIGSAVQPETEKSWKALGRWVKKFAVKVPRGGPQQSTPPEIWAFSGAQAMFEAGAKGGAMSKSTPNSIINEYNAMRCVYIKSETLIDGENGPAVGYTYLLNPNR